MATRREKTHPDTDALLQHLRALKLPFMLEQHQALAQTAADKPWSHLEYLGELLAGEAAARELCAQQLRRVLNLAALQDRAHPTAAPPAHGPLREFEPRHSEPLNAGGFSVPQPHSTSPARSFHQAA